MWEYKREETDFGSYTPELFFKLLNNYGKEGWQILHYNEQVNERKDYRFIVVLQKERAE